jgi:hypothetical protein
MLSAKVRTPEQVIPDSVMIKLGVPLIRGYAESLIRTGLLDPKGKDTAQIVTEVVRLVCPQLDKGKAFLTIDHTDVLLREARRYARQNNSHLACLLYATWLEHWANAIIADLLTGKGFSNDDVASIIREVPYRGKATWLFRLLGFPPVLRKHLLRVSAILEIRNSFVHYKWKIIDRNSDEVEKQRQHEKRTINEVEETIKYLRSRENSFFFRGSKKTLVPSKKLMRQITSDQRGLASQSPRVFMPTRPPA